MDMTIAEAKEMWKRIQCHRKLCYAFHKMHNKGINGRVNKLYRNDFKFDV